MRHAQQDLQKQGKCADSNGGIFVTFVREAAESFFTFNVKEIKRIPSLNIDNVEILLIFFNLKISVNVIFN